MPLSKVTNPRRGYSLPIGKIKVPQVGDTSLTGFAPPYAVVQLYKGNSTTQIGTAFADVTGAWAFTLGTPVAAGDIYRTLLLGGVLVPVAA